MLKVARRGVLARKFRLALTGTAVLLGVMFVTTTYVLTDTLDRSAASDRKSRRHPSMLGAAGAAPV